MSKQKQPKPTKTLPALSEIAAGIRGELRDILHQAERLGRPFQPIPHPVQLSDHFPFLLAEMSSPEEVQNAVLRFAGAVYQLKDRLAMWVEANGMGLRDETGANTDIEKLAQRCTPLMICGDLFNSKKHGENRNRSGFKPVLGGVQIQNAVGNPMLIGLRYDGATKQSEIALKSDDPIRFTVEVLAGDGSARFGHAVDLIKQAFCYWLPIIKQLAVLESPDPESVFLKRRLFATTTAPTP